LIAPVQTNQAQDPLKGFRALMPQVENDAMTKGFRSVLCVAVWLLCGSTYAQASVKCDDGPKGQPVCMDDGKPMVIKVAAPPAKDNDDKNDKKDSDSQGEKDKDKKHPASP